MSPTNDGRRLTVIAVLYLDSFRKIGDSWFFAERIACVDWTDERAMA